MASADMPNSRTGHRPRLSTSAPHRKLELSPPDTDTKMFTLGKGWGGFSFAHERRSLKSGSVHAGSILYNPLTLNVGFLPGRRHDRVPSLFLGPIRTFLGQREMQMCELKQKLEQGEWISWAAALCGGSAGGYQTFLEDPPWSKPPCTVAGTSSAHHGSPHHRVPPRAGVIVSFVQTGLGKDGRP